MSQLVSRHAVVQTAGLTLLLVPLAGSLLRRVLGKSDEQSMMSFFAVLRQYCGTDFRTFMKGHRDAIKTGNETGDHVPGVINYYTLMSDLITMTSGPYWHFVPMFHGLSRAECHERFHHIVAKYLGAGKGDSILEIGCGYGECGRQVAKISGSNVTGLTMAETEVVGANARIKAAGLEGQCKMVQGDYHKTGLEASSFEKVFGIYTLKYSSNLEGVFKEAARLLKPGGTFLSYEILVTDKYDPQNADWKSYVENISTCTCMPPLWHAQAMRDAARKAGLVAVCEEDIGTVADAKPWYTCFTGLFGVYNMLACPLVMPFFHVCEKLRLLPPSFSDWFENLLIHPTVDFVRAGRAEVISCTKMMTWKKHGS